MQISTPQNPPEASTSTTKLTSIIEQSIYIAPSFQFECGAELREVPVAYKTWGSLNEARDNAMVICHAFTGSADVVDWCVEESCPQNFGPNGSVRSSAGGDRSWGPARHSTPEDFSLSAATLSDRHMELCPQSQSIRIQGNHMVPIFHLQRFETIFSELVWLFCAVLS